MNKNVYSVGQLNTYIKRMFEEDFLLSNISVQGEVSNYKCHSSGHIYFTIKDGQGAMSAIMFKGNRPRGLQFPMKDGDQVVVTGSVSVYERGGTYQIYAREITLAGAGDLYLRFEQLKKELEEMGMFAPEYKKPVPKFATRVGIVTAPTGAAVRDIIQISKRRNPFVELILCPALVQGAGAVESIISGIQRLDAMDLDVLIVGRGGGSIEDLWAFNEEEVARTIFSCNTPVISAVGHQTDTTISDYVADLRAPTPSAAAELAVFSFQEWQQTTNQFASLLYRGLEEKIEDCQNRILAFEKQFRYLSPANRLDEKRQYCLMLEQRLERGMENLIKDKRQCLSLLAGKLDGVSPAKKLAQGYSYTADTSGKAITSVSQVKSGDALTVYVSDGRIQAKVMEMNEDVKWKI